jgi:hypothetical protein
MCLDYLNLKTLNFEVIQTNSGNLSDFYFYKKFSISK